MVKRALEPPDLQTINGRLRWAREAWMGHDSSARAAAQRFGWNENTYKAHEQGLRGAEGLKVATAKKYARAFHVRVEWLMTGQGSPEPAKKPQEADEWEAMSPEDRALALRLLQAAKAG